MTTELGRHSLTRTLWPRARHQSHHSRCDLPAPGAQEVAQVIDLAHAAKPEDGPAATGLNAVTQP
jgi:hypothetical protein